MKAEDAIIHIYKSMLVVRPTKLHGEMWHKTSYIEEVINQTLDMVRSDEQPSKNLSFRDNSQ